MFLDPLVLDMGHATVHSNYSHSMSGGFLSTTHSGRGLVVCTSFSRTRARIRVGALEQLLTISGGAPPLQLSLLLLLRQRRRRRRRQLLPDTAVSYGRPQAVVVVAAAAASFPVIMDLPLPPSCLCEPACGQAPPPSCGIEPRLTGHHFPQESSSHGDGGSMASHGHCGGTDCQRLWPWPAVGVLPVDVTGVAGWCPLVLGGLPGLPHR